ncbi:siderophore-iron reductase FhuF [Pseudomonas eucalypticola]|uniref:Siderophore-iron reductase FhuF n=1 Tax=Pseudomonas eucalypticola TaxID=2599595 RepID=A0A7D5H5X8_9PSED|nr:siderophore-iron reductase FhuF [Pseudomonas eucalypticola]QKZ06422.1 siderophore-iron reductase FhuF [Pseudomonas eucalypticola]
MNHEWATGPCAGMLHGLVPAADPRPAIPLDRALATAHLDAALLRIYGPALFAEQKPVLVSQWSKYFFMHWLPAVLVTQLAYGWYLPLQLDQLALVLDERGLPLGVKLLEEGEPGEADESLEPVVQASLRPFVERLSAYGEVPTAVLWGNAGDYLEQAVVRLQALGVAVGPALALLQARKAADGRGNPLYEPVRYLPDGKRQRRSCCLAYKVEWVGPCEHCPLVA